MANLLIVDDEMRIREVIKEYGKLYNHVVYQACDGLQAIEMVKNNNIDLIILDIMMPNMDGYTTLKKINDIKPTPVIMLSARTEEEDKLQGFDLGIDDYVSKPFSPKELMARVNVVLKRYSKNTSLIVIDDLVIDPSAYTVKVEDNIVHLTNKEFQLLLYLIENENIVISREKLLEKIWGEDSFSYDRTVDTHVKMLRKNLGKYADLIKTVRGVGYKFEK